MVMCEPSRRVTVAAPGKHDWLHDDTVVLRNAHTVMHSS